MSYLGSFYYSRPFGNIWNAGFPYDVEPFRLGDEVFVDKINNSSNQFDQVKTFNNAIKFGKLLDRNNNLVGCGILGGTGTAWNFDHQDKGLFENYCDNKILNQDNDYKYAMTKWNFSCPVYQDYEPSRTEVPKATLQLTEYQTKLISDEFEWRDRTMYWSLTPIFNYTPKAPGQYNYTHFDLNFNRIYIGAGRNFFYDEGTYNNQCILYIKGLEQSTTNTDFLSRDRDTGQIRWKATADLYKKVEELEARINELEKNKKRKKNDTLF